VTSVTKDRAVFTTGVIFRCVSVHQTSEVERRIRSVQVEVDFAFGLRPVYVGPPLRRAEAEGAVRRRIVSRAELPALCCAHGWSFAVVRVDATPGCCGVDLRRQRSFYHEARGRGLASAGRMPIAARRVEFNTGVLHA
jgi:hypothetical protein